MSAEAVAAIGLPTTRRRTLPPRLDLGLLGCLLLLTLAVAQGWWPVALDHAIEGALPGAAHGGRTALALRVAGAVTDLADPAGTVAVTLAIAASLSLVTRSRLPAAFVVPRLVALTVTVLGGKALLHRVGPLGSPVSGLHGYFPSGHTTTALVCTGVLASIVRERHPGWTGRLYAVVAGWTALVALCLVVHRYHWPTDVVGAMLLGTLVLRRTPGPGRALPPSPGPAGP